MINNKQLTPILIILVIVGVVAVSGVFYYQAQKQKTEIPNENTNAVSQTSISPPAQQPSPISTTTPPVSGGVDQEKSLIFIEPKNSSFTISNLPDVKFKITRATKATGSVTLETGCNGKPSTTFTKYLYFGSSGLCISATTVDGRERALVAVDVDVTNNSAKQFSGDLLQLFYNLKVNGEDATRLATVYLPFRSYTIEPFSNRTIRVGFVIPDNQDEVELTYGYYGADYRSGENFLSKVEDGFVINFKTKTFSEIPG